MCHFQVVPLSPIDKVSKYNDLVEFCFFKNMTGDKVESNLEPAV